MADQTRMDPEIDPAIVRDIGIERLRFKDDGEVPNNPVLPALIYRNALPAAAGAEAVKRLFEANRWFRVWDWTVYDFHHYHSNAHEVLAVCDGSARLMLGGAAGAEVEVSSGDVMILPPGTGHKLLDGRDGFRVCGGYPEGQEDRDLIRASPEEYPGKPERIAAVPLPATDPVYGPDGPLLPIWTEHLPG